MAGVCVVEVAESDLMHKSARGCRDCHFNDVGLSFMLLQVS